jgi:hypothetical protein
MMPDEIISNRVLLKQSTLDKFALNADFDDHESFLHQIIDDEDPASKSINLWTRVFSRPADDQRTPGIFNLGPDLLLDQSLRDSLSQLAEPRGQLLFSPLEIKQKQLDLRLSSHRLSEDELINFAKVASKIRREIN